MVGGRLWSRYKVLDGRERSSWNPCLVWHLLSIIHPGLAAGRGAWLPCSPTVVGVFEGEGGGGCVESSAHVSVCTTDDHHLYLQRTSQQWTRTRHSHCCS